MKAKLEIYKLGMRENAITVVSASLCVGLIAIGTGSIHCLWGLLILINLNTFTQSKESR